ncbi:hypothetical protein RQP46_001622 [Phenoliferia psychrophenolica]
MVCLPGQLLLAVFGSRLPGRPAHARPSFSWDATSVLFNFGDSYSATGWLPSNDLRSPDPGRTEGGGPNWLMNLNANRSDIFMRNFAEGGAVVDSELIAPDRPSIRSLTQQVDIVFGHRRGER